MEENMIEITLRLPAQAWGEAIRAIAGIRPAEDGGSLPQRREENPTFDWGQFARLQREETSAGLRKTERAEGETAREEAASPPETEAELPQRPVVQAQAGRLLSGPAPAARPGGLPGGPEAEAAPSFRPGRSGERAGQRQMERRWEQDSRRYDGGFALY